MTAQEKFLQWQKEVKALDISANFMDLIALFRQIQELNKITQQAEKEHQV